MTAIVQQRPLPEFDDELQRCITCQHPVLDEGRTRHHYCPPPERIPCDCGRVFDGPTRIAKFVAHFDTDNGPSPHDRTVGRHLTAVVCGD